MAQQDLGDLKERAQLYNNEINDEDFTDDRSVNVKTAGYQRADVFVDFTRDVVDEISIQHLSSSHIEQVKDETASPTLELKDLLYKKTVTDDKKFKFPIDLNAEYTQLIFSALSAAVESVVYLGTTGLDDATSSGTFSGSEHVTYLIEIDGTGTPDTFKWSKDGGVTWEATTVNITTDPQTLDDGVEITFTATTGHTLADQWTIRAGYGSSNDKITVDISLR